MIAAHRHNFDRAPLDWTSAMNLFSLMFALLLALAIIVLLLLCFYQSEQGTVLSVRPRSASHHALLQ
jgi:hypothetical protein